MAQVRDRKRALGNRGSANQKKELICHLEKDVCFARNQYTTDDERIEFNKKWNELADKLNALGGAKKSGLGWRKYWYDLRSRVSRRCTTVRANWTESGRSGDIMILLSDLDRRILSLMSIDSVDDDEVSLDIELVAKPNSSAESTYTIVYKEANGQYETLPSTSRGEDINDERIVAASPTSQHPQKDRKRKKEVDDESEYFKELLKLKEEQLNLLKEDNERKRRKEQRQIEKHEIEMKILKKKLDVESYGILDSDSVCMGNLENSLSNMKFIF